MNSPILVMRPAAVGVWMIVGSIGRRPTSTGDQLAEGRSNMWFGLSIIGIIIWVAIAFWPARVADRKGHSFFGYFMLSLSLLPARADHGVRGG